jgi:hypothetical protein
MSPVRMHFWMLVAREYGASSRAVRYGMNGTMPATVNSKEGSLETSEAEGTAVWPLLTKKSTQRFVISCDFMS